jgi:hypothetical protein
MVDSKDLALVEDAMKIGVERLGAREVAPEGLLDDDPRAVRRVAGVGDEAGSREAVIDDAKLLGGMAR